MQILNNKEIKSDEYERGGIIYCSKCGTPRSYIPSTDEDTYTDKVFACLCECQMAELDSVRSQIEKKLLHEFSKAQKEKSFLGERYHGVSFQNTDITNPNFNKAYQRCLKYYMAFNTVYDKGFGIYLYGNCGCGKTHLAACIANALVEDGVDVIVTNFFEIAKTIKKTFSRSYYSESEFIESLAYVDFLVIDDIGTERVQSKDGEELWLQEKIYDVINKRYNAKKPTFFSSNFSLQELVDDRGILEKTVSRIAAMSTAVIELQGEDYRMKNRSKQDIF